MISLSAQGFAILGAHAELGEHVVGVCAERSAGEADPARRLGHPPHHVVLDDPAQVGVVDLGEHAGRADVRVLDQVAGAVDGRDGGAGLGEGGEDLVAGARGDPAADVVVEEVGVLGAGVAGREPRLVDHLGVADQGMHALGDAWALVEIATQWPSLVS